jgi:hypothetical protein
MNKLNLSTEELTVDSFDTGISPIATRGTVQGMTGDHSVCTRVQFPLGDSNFDQYCQPGLTNDEPSCYNLTCYYTCEALCTAEPYCYTEKPPT